MLLTGADAFVSSSLNGKLKEVIMSDASNGVRKMDKDGNTIKAVAFPSLSVLANFWDRELVCEEALILPTNALK